MHHAAAYRLSAFLRTRGAGASFGLNNTVRVAARPIFRNSPSNATPSWRPRLTSSTSTPSETARESTDTTTADKNAAKSTAVPGHSEATPSSVAESIDSINAEISALIGQLRLPQAKAQQSSRPGLQPGQKEFLRFARLYNIPKGTTPSDITYSLAETAPVGRVLSVTMDKTGPQDRASAIILFDHDAAVRDLVRLARQRTFHIGGVTPHVAIYSKRAFHSNDQEPSSSRVLRIDGPRTTPHFSEDGIRELVHGSPQIMAALGEWGLASEPVVTVDHADGSRSMEWRFFHNLKQVRPMQMFLRRVFHGALSIRPGFDPCWNSTLYPRERESSPYQIHLNRLRPSTRWTAQPEGPVFRTVESGRKEQQHQRQQRYEASDDPDNEYLTNIRQFKARLKSPELTADSFTSLLTKATDKYGSDSFDPKIATRLDDLMKRRQAAIDALGSEEDLPEQPPSPPPAAGLGSLSQEDRARVLAWRKMGARG